jgi:tRNA threonylcarbamoyladenosine biosynthesis protein TsaB
MIILAIDTSGRQGSAALCRGDADTFETLQVTHLEGGSYSARLMPVIADLLQDNGFARNDADGYVVVSGPGSFTGLRVGLATVKGLCEVRGKPLATVSMLEAIALRHGCGRVTAVLDAGRGEMYVGEYLVQDGKAALLREYMGKLAEFRPETTDVVLTSDEKIVELLQTAGVNMSLVALVHADDIGRIGWRKLLAGEVADVMTVDVNYIRRSDAELFARSKA